MKENDCRYFFKADAKSNFFPRMCRVSIKSITNGSRDFSKKKLDVQKFFVCMARHIAATTTSQINLISIRKF